MLQIPVTEADASTSASDFQLDSLGSTLLAYKGFAQTASVPGTVKTIGQSAFEDKDTLTEVTLPNSVTKIEPYAFWGCDNLGNIELGTGIKDIGDYAFMNCTGLKTYTIPSTVKSIGIQAFANCSNLTSITIPASVTYIHPSAFDGCPNLALQYVPDTYGEEYAQAFATRQQENAEYEDVAGYEGAANATSESGSGSQSAGTSDLTGMSDANPTDATTDLTGVTDMSSQASEDTGLTGTDAAGSRPKKGIPNVVNISKLSEALKRSPGSGADTANGASTSETTGTDASASGTAGNDAPGLDGTDENSGMDNVTVPAVTQNDQMLGSTRIVGNHAVLFLDNNAMVVNSTQPSITSDGTESESNMQTDPSGLTEQSNTSGLPGDQGLTDQTNFSSENIPKYTQVEYLGKQLIADQAFYANKTLSTVTIPSGITEIGQFAYARSSLQQLQVPEGTRHIGYGAFYHCDSLTDVTLPATIQTVEPMAFTHTGWVDQFMTSGTDDYLISGGVLVAYRGTAPQITLPDQVRVIAADVFKGHTELQSVKLPYGLEVVGEGAFEGCTSLTTINGGDNLTQIKDRAFKDCPLIYIDIPASVTHIGLGAYDFTNTQKETTQKTAVFEGITLPTLSFETSAKRLSNQVYRTSPLQDVKFAVIDQNTTENDLKDTILYSSILPFMGIIGSLTEDGFFECRFTCINAHEFDPLSLPGTVQINNASYPITGIDTMEYLPWTENAAQAPKTVLVSGIEGATASLSGSNETLILKIELAADPTPMTAAYQRVYRSDLPSGTVVYDMELADNVTGVPITKLGTQEMLVTIPVPEHLLGQNIRVMTLDRNGQLERVTAKTQMSDEKAQITFMTNHFSLFAFSGN
jgi:hypothetical protein